MEGPENKENLNICVYLNTSPPSENKCAKSDKNYQFRVVFNRLGGPTCWEAPLLGGPRKALPLLDKNPWRRHRFHLLGNTPDMTDALHILVTGTTISSAHSTMIPRANIVESTGLVYGYRSQCDSNGLSETCNCDKT